MIIEISKVSLAISTLARSDDVAQWLGVNQWSGGHMLGLEAQSPAGAMKGAVDG